MPTSPVYKHLDAYTFAKKLVCTCYELMLELPEEERSLSGLRLRTAALSAYLCIAQSLMQGNQKKQKKLLREARMNLLIVDATLDLLGELHLVREEKKNEVNYLLLHCFEVTNKSNGTE